MTTTFSHTGLWRVAHRVCEALDEVELVCSTHLRTLLEPCAPLKRGRRERRRPRLRGRRAHAVVQAAAEAVHAALPAMLCAVCIAQRQHRHHRRGHLPTAATCHVRRDGRGCGGADARQAAHALRIAAQEVAMAVGVIH